MSSEPPAEIAPAPTKPAGKTPSKLKFSLPEKLFMLTLDEAGGAVEPSVKDALRPALAGAVLVELAQANRLRLEENRLVLANRTRTGNKVLDSALAAIAADPKARKPAHWMAALGDKEILRQVAGQLAERGVLRIEEQRRLWLLPYNAASQPDATAKYWIKRRLRAVLLAGGKAAPADLALLDLLEACRLLKLLCTRDERAAAEKKIAALAQNPALAFLAPLLAEVETAVAGERKG